MSRARAASRRPAVALYHPPIQKTRVDFPATGVLRAPDQDGAVLIPAFLGNAILPAVKRAAADLGLTQVKVPRVQGNPSSPVRVLARCAALAGLMRQCRVKNFPLRAIAASSDRPNAARLVAGITRFVEARKACALAASLVSPAYVTRPHGREFLCALFGSNAAEMASMQGLNGAAGGAGGASGDGVPLSDAERRELAELRAAFKELVGKSRGSGGGGRSHGAGHSGRRSSRDAEEFEEDEGSEGSMLDDEDDATSGDQYSDDPVVRVGSKRRRVEEDSDDEPRRKGKRSGGGGASSRGPVAYHLPPSGGRAAPTTEPARKIGQAVRPPQHSGPEYDGYYALSIQELNALALTAGVRLLSKMNKEERITALMARGVKPVPKPGSR